MKDLQDHPYFWPTHLASYQVKSRDELINLSSQLLYGILAFFFTLIDPYILFNFCYSSIHTYINYNEVIHQRHSKLHKLYFSTNYEWNILVITQVKGEAEDTGDNQDIS